MNIDAASRSTGRRSESLTIIGMVGQHGPNVHELGPNPSWFAKV